MGRFVKDEIVWTGKVWTGIENEESFIRIMECANAIDDFDEELDKNGDIIFGSRQLEQCFEKAGWEKHYARIPGVRLVKLTEELSVYGSSSRKTAWLAKNDNNGTTFLGFTGSHPEIKPIETFYRGCRFRSRLEARWAVFFDACGLEWDYEPEGFDLGDGILYLPDFYLQTKRGRGSGGLWVEVKGVMTPEDEEKIIRFAGVEENGCTVRVEHPIYVVGNIPKGTTFEELQNDLDMYHKGRVPFFNFKYVDGDYFGAIPCITGNSIPEFELCGDDSNYLLNVNKEKTMDAYNAARQARFEHGECGMKLEPVRREWQYSGANLDPDELKKIAFED